MAANGCTNCTGCGGFGSVAIPIFKIPSCITVAYDPSDYRRFGNKTDFLQYIDVTGKVEVRNGEFSIIRVNHDHPWKLFYRGVFLKEIENNTMMIKHFTE